MKKTKASKKKGRSKQLIDVSGKANIRFGVSNSSSCPIYKYDIKNCSYNPPVERILGRSALTIFKERLSTSKKKIS